jgi:hypothetical protein
MRDTPCWVSTFARKGEGMETESDPKAASWELRLEHPDVVALTVGGWT